VISHTTERFRKAFRELPTKVQRRARQIFRMWKIDPWHPIFHFKQIHPTEPIYSIRVGIGWRALGIKQEDHLIWFWIGSHADYDNLLKQM
jgi:hypothetical protein